MQQDRLKQLKRYLEDSPNDPFLLFAIAKEYEGIENTSEALVYYEKLTIDSPDYIGTYYHLGKLFEKLAQPQQAILTYQKGIDWAKKKGDQHALSELQSAKINLEIS